MNEKSTAVVLGGVLEIPYTLDPKPKTLLGRIKYMNFGTWGILNLGGTLMDARDNWA